MTRYESSVDALLEELTKTLRSVNAEAVHALTQAILQARRIFVAGKGRSGLHMRAFAMRLMHLGLTAHVVDDVTTPGIAAGDLLVIGSGSGRTASLVHYAARAKALSAQVALLTIAPSSPVAEHADCLVQIRASTPKLGENDGAPSILPMGSLFEHTMGLVLDIVIVHLMADLGVDAGQMFARHANLE